LAAQLDAQPMSFYEQTPYVRPGTPDVPDVPDMPDRLDVPDVPCKDDIAVIWSMVLEVKQAANRLHAEHADMTDELVCQTVLSQLPHTSLLYERYQSHVYRVLATRNLDSEFPSFMRMMQKQFELGQTRLVNSASCDTDQPDQPDRPSELDKAVSSIKAGKPLLEICLEFCWHADLASIALARNGMLLYHAPDCVRNDPELVGHAVRQNGLALRWASWRLQQDPRTVNMAVCQRAKAIRYARHAGKSRENCLLAVTQNPHTLIKAGKQARQDKEIVMAAVARNGMMLEYALCVDADIVATAVKQNNDALRFVTNISLYQDAECLVAMVAKNEYMLSYPCFADQVGICSAVVAKNGMALRHASSVLRKNYDIVRAAVQQHCQAFEFADPVVQNDAEFVLQMIAVSPGVLRWASPRLRNNKQLVMASVAQDGMMLKHALYCDDEVVATAINQNNKALQYVNHIPDCLSIRQLVVQNHDFLGYKCMADQADICLEVVERNGLHLQYVSPVLRQNDKIVRAAVQQNYQAFEFAGSNLKVNFDFVMSLVTDWPAALHWVSGRLKNDIRIVHAAVTKDYTSFVYAGNKFWIGFPCSCVVGSPRRRGDFMRMNATDRGSQSWIVEHVTNLLAKQTDQNDPTSRNSSFQSNQSAHVAPLFILFVAECCHSSQLQATLSTNI